jgi:hypothetical protein
MTNTRRISLAEHEALVGAMEDDSKRAFDGLVEMERNPTRWFCMGFVEVAIPRVFARAKTEDDVITEAREEATRYIVEKRSCYRKVPPLTEWTFLTYPPTAWSVGGSSTR